MDGGRTDHLGLDFDASSHRRTRFHLGPRHGWALTGRGDFARTPKRGSAKEAKLPFGRFAVGLRFRATECQRNRLERELVSKRPAYTACRPSFARHTPALPRVTCRFAPAQSCAARHRHLSPSSAHRRKRKNTLRRRASATIRLRSPASEFAHKSYAPDHAKTHSECG